MKIASLNLANASIDETSPCRFGLRLDAICDEIPKDVDVLHLSELRICADAEGSGQLHPVEIVRRIAETSGLHVAMAQPNNDTLMCQWKATLYNPKSCVHTGSTVGPIGVSLKYPHNVLVSHFTHKKAGDFATINVHFTIYSQDDIVRWLVDFASKIVCDGPVIFLGDCNTFMDLPVGVEQTRILRTGFHLDSSSAPTFRSFPHNPWQGESTLDHYGLSKVHKSAKVTFHVNEINHRVSDHALVVAEVTV